MAECTEAERALLDAFAGHGNYSWARAQLVIETIRRDSPGIEVEIRRHVEAEKHHRAAWDQLMNTLLHRYDVVDQSGRNRCEFSAVWDWLVEGKEPWNEKGSEP